ncbi:MAG TPA: ABC transporter substrate-binding protein [Burkholderiaceae bacterium]|nr:ABC transporter substrate-binding protein [Burkholderiaceae bacterium]
MSAALLAGGVAQAEPGVSDTRILLGQSAPFSGPAQALGVRMNLGAKVFFDALNAQGGVNGRRVVIKTRDDGYEADRAAANTRAFLNEDEVFALFGYVGTPTSLAAKPIFTEARVPFVAPFTGAEALRNPMSRYIFNVRASYFDETEHIVKQLSSVGMKRIAVFHQNDTYGQAGLAGVQRATKALNLSIVATGTVERNSTDVAKALDALLPSKPDVIVQISAYSSCAAFIKEARKRGYTGTFYNVSFVGSTALADALGEAGNGVGISQVVPFPWDRTKAIVREYQKTMIAAGHNDFDFTSLEGYISAKVMAEGLRRAGQSPTREGLIKGLESLRGFDVGDFVVSFGSNDRSGSSWVELTMIGANKVFRH